MTPHASKVLERFEALDRLLQTKGFPATSPWWHETIRRWYESGRRQLVVRAGRRAGKSSTLSRLGVVEALYGEHAIPSGDTGVVAVISTRREEAAERITTIKAILDALGAAYTPWGEHGVRLAGRPIGFRVYTASIAGVSGFTGIFVFADECAKWKDADLGVNPASEVLRSVRPTLLTQPNAKIVLSSSPMGQLDAHYDAFEEGDTELQVTAFAETWVANPSTTEEQTRELEPDEQVWLREYAARPLAGSEESLLIEALVDRATRPSPAVLPYEAGHWYAAAIDPALRGDSFPCVIATRSPDRRRRIVLAHEWRGTRARPLNPTLVFQELRALLEPYKLRWVHTDQHSSDALAEIARQQGLGLHMDPWTATNKAEAYEGLRALLLAGDLELPPDRTVKSDLLGIRKRITRAGVTYELARQGGRHSDFAAAIAMVCRHVQGVAKPIVEETEREKERAAKEKFLEDIRKQRERRERHGAMPVTHRRRLG